MVMTATANVSKVEVYPEREYITKGIKEGWITIQLIGMKHIIVDHAYQARVVSLDMAHVKLLADMRQEQIDAGQGEYLFPIVVFVTPKGKFLLTDGFHRHEENRQRRGVSIMAYVVKVDDWEHQARLYSTMCNRLALKKRTDEDVRKAVEILFDDEECWEWADLRIGDHCGKTYGCIRNWRREYHVKTGKPLPENVKRRDGVVYPYKNKEKVKSGKLPNITIDTKGKSFASHRGKPIYLGVRDNNTESKLQAIIASEENKRIRLDTEPIRRLLLSAGIHPDPSPFKISGSKGLVGRNFVATTLDFRAGEPILQAWGCIRLLWRYAGNPENRMIIVCYPEDGPQDVIDLAKQDGIEFLTPDELVASLKATEGKDHTQ